MYRHFNNWLKWKQWLILLLMLPVIQLAEAQTVEVGSTHSHATITGGLQHVSAGDTLIIHEGVYAEHNLQVNEPITIEGRGKVVIDAEKEGYGLVIKSDSVTVRNLEVRNSSTSFMEDYAGILLEQVSHVLLEDLRMTDNFFGIYLAHSSHSTIRNVQLTASGERETSSGNGIHLWYSKQITIENNEIRGHRDGIYFEFVDSSRISNNLSEGNLRYGLHFMFSDDCIYRNNTFRDNGAGVAVMFTDNVIMEHNRFEDNWGTAAYGLLLKELRDSRIAHNVFVNNTIGLYSEASNRMLVEHNEFRGNGWAIKLMANSIDNRFERNNFIANTFDVSTNSRQNYNHFEGNYWSQYEGYDLDRDGVGDVPYRPVRLFSILVEQRPQALILLRSLLIDLLDTAERFLPVLTPETLVDSKPQMRIIS